jgi:hypothetical protein
MVESTRPIGISREDAARITRLLDRIFQALDAEGAERLKHLGFEFETDYLVLKGHLLVQSAFADALELHLHEPRYLEDARFGFHQHLCLARSVLDGKVADWAWEAATLLNQSRNELAHRLAPTRFDDRLQRFLAYVGKCDPEIGALSTDKLRLFVGIMVLYSMFVAPFGADRERRLLSAALGSFIAEGQAIKLEDLAGLAPEPPDAER